MTATQTADRTLENALARAEKAAQRPADGKPPHLLHHYETGQSPNQPGLPGVWIRDRIHGSAFVTTFQTQDEASMSAAALNRARPLEAPVVRKLHQQEQNATPAPWTT